MAFPVRARVLAAPSLLLLAACDNPQDPEPLEKTVPTAMAIVGGWGALAAISMVLVLRWIRRRRDVTLVRQPVAVALLTMVPAVLVGAPLVLGMGWMVAFGYQEPTMSLFSWDETVSIHLIVSGASLLLVGAAASVTLLVTQTNRVVVAIGQLALAMPVACIAVVVLAAGEPSAGALFGLVCAAPWTVAFVLSWQQRTPTPAPYVPTGEHV